MQTSDYITNQLTITSNHIKCCETEATDFKKKDILQRMHKIINKISIYYYKNILQLSENEEICTSISYDLGSLSGIILKYKKDGILTQYDIENLNSIYKKYKQIERKHESS